uniref:non-specific serine/threonine protein kinase n=2 Tax=Rhizophora mucronata TaxID=61149 RepID=A0A2P2L5V9_RHIMU
MTVYAVDQHKEISSDLGEGKNVVASSKNSEDSVSPLVNGADMNIIHGMNMQVLKSSIPQLDIINSKHLVRGQIMPSPMLSTRHGHASPVSIFANPKHDRTDIMWSMEENKSVISNSSSELHLEDKDFDIQWSDLTLKEEIGAGSFGTVHRGYWHGSEVAVKILERDFYAEGFKEFLSEVAIMKRLRHPNIVLFMGAVTQPPHLSIVTEYLSGGSLHKLLRSPYAYLILDERLRLNMAYDVAKGMNHLHQLRPPIVHRDLKSPNLLVDSTYTVKVCVTITHKN